MGFTKVARISNSQFLFSISFGKQYFSENQNIITMQTMRGDFVVRYFGVLGHKKALQWVELIPSLKVLLMGKCQHGFYRYMGE